MTMPWMLKSDQEGCWQNWNSLTLRANSGRETKTQKQSMTEGSSGAGHCYRKWGGSTVERREQAEASTSSFSSSWTPRHVAWGAAPAAKRWTAAAGPAEAPKFGGRPKTGSFWTVDWLEVSMELGWPRRSSAGEIWMKGQLCRPFGCGRAEKIIVIVCGHQRGNISVDYRGAV